MTADLRPWLDALSWARIPIGRRCTALTLAAKADGIEVQASNAQLSHILGIPALTVKTHLKELEQAGWVVRTSVGSRDSGGSRYRFLIPTGESHHGGEG